ncbi:MAG: M28 family metallopeptidase [Kiritimatiellia bacterium]|nr:M28 family metallopeptidase [Kiritimatiellia bacterium]MDD4173727.1 M28 family metallopeptidase [Kiritimatiellia bacterium]MDD4441215.1 M28 family metallopeptidase [Kiritimatiellia bacterium]NLC82834.1 M28 family peptidase [Lentisphaerota bacterium]
MRKLRWMCGVFLLAFVGCGDKPPAAAAMPARSALSFSASQATQALAHVTGLVEQCTPRDAGTPGAEKAARWILDRLAERGVDARIDRFTDPTPRGPKPFFNVLATLPGTGDGWIVLLSHFDTMGGISEGFQGANDSGSSTGLLIELAAILRAAGPLPHTILCGFMDGEECMLAYSDRDGFHGSRRLARQMKAEGRSVKAVILMDMVGDRDLKLTVPRNGTGALRLLALKAAEATGDRDRIGLFDGIVYDDHQAFLDLGFPAVNLIDFEFGSAPGLNDYWHTPADTLDKLSAESLLTTGRIVLEMVNRLSH